MRIVFLSFFVIGLSGCFSTSELSVKTLESPSELEILESYHIQLPEISGLAWRTHPETKEKELLAVGDRKFLIVTIKWSNDRSKGETLQATETDLAFLFKPKPKEQSEWESIYSDDSGRVFLIKENPSMLIVISSDLKRIEQTVSLDLSSFIKKDGSDKNSGLEGLLLLSNGHFLGLKEKNLISLFEFAPRGEKPRGYSPALSIEMSGVFSTQKTSRGYDAVKVMRFNKKDENLIEDASGINVDTAGNLYLLSDQKRMIVSLGNKLSPDQKNLKALKAWRFPKAIKQPEGLVFDEQGHPIVAIDTKKKGKLNLFRLSKLK